MIWNVWGLLRWATFFKQLSLKSNTDRTEVPKRKIPMWSNRSSRPVPWGYFVQRDLATWWKRQAEGGSIWSDLEGFQGIFHWASFFRQQHWQEKARKKTPRWSTRPAGLAKRSPLRMVKEEARRKNFDCRIIDFDSIGIVSLKVWLTKICYPWSWEWRGLSKTLKI